jgi:hypothetical protein
MIRTFAPPSVAHAGQRELSFVSTWRDIVSRRATWRADPMRVRAWLQLTEMFNVDPVGPWPMDERLLAVLTHEFRYLGDDALRHVSGPDLHYLMLSIVALEAAATEQVATIEPESNDATAAAAE